MKIVHPKVFVNKYKDSEREAKYEILFDHWRRHYKLKSFSLSVRLFVCAFIIHDFSKVIACNKNKKNFHYWAWYFHPFSKKLWKQMRRERNRNYFFVHFRDCMSSSLPSTRIIIYERHFPTFPTHSNNSNIAFRLLIH